MYYNCHQFQLHVLSLNFQAKFVSTLCCNSCDELNLSKIHLQPLIVVFILCTPASDSVPNAVILLVQTSIVSSEVPFTYNKSDKPDLVKKYIYIVGAI